MQEIIGNTAKKSLHSHIPGPKLVIEEAPPRHPRWAGGPEDVDVACI